MLKCGLRQSEKEAHRGHDQWDWRAGLREGGFRGGRTQVKPRGGFGFGEVLAGRVSPMDVILFSANIYLICYVTGIFYIYTKPCQVDI